MTNLIRPAYDWPGHAPKVVSAERRLVTVLFADIVQSTRFVLSSDPEEANERLIPVLNIMAELVFQYGGTLAQVLGDGVLALFGVPRALEEHALRGCFAAAEMQKVIANMDDDLRIRIGLSSGEIIVESCSNGEYRPVGATVHLAAKAQAMAPAGQIILTEKSYNHVSHQVTARPFLPLNLSPHLPAIRTYVLEDVKSRGRRPTTQVRRLDPPPFTGRGKELTLLNNSLPNIAPMNGTVVRIVGEAGIGKTRLIDRFLSLLPTRTYRIERYELQPAGMQNAFEAAAYLLFPALGLPVDLTPAQLPSTATLIGKIKDTGAVRPTDIPAMLDVLGYGEHTPNVAEPRSKLRIAMRGIVAIAIKASRQKPAIFVLENIHWADTETQILVEELVKNIKDSRLLILLTTRDSLARNSNNQIDGHEEITLGPLSRTDSRQLVQQVIGSQRHINMDLLDLVLEKGQGNPFFMEECAKIWLGQSTHDHAVQMPPAQDPFRVPETVHAVLAERIDSLSPTARDLLLLMSVIGDTIDFRVLQQVATNKLAVTLAALPELVASGLISRTRILPQVEYRFKHALVRDVAYNTLPRSARHRIHSHVFEAFRKDILGQAQPPALAYHALRSERWRDAYAYSHRAAQDAARNSRNREARDHYTGALEALEHLPQTRRSDQRAVDIHNDLASTLSTMGRHREARKSLTIALQTARRLHDRKRCITALSDAALRKWADGRLKKASAASSLAYRLAKSEGMTKTAVQSLIRFGMILADRGELTRAKKILLEATQLIPERDKFESFGLLSVALSSALANLAAVHGELGDFQQAIQTGDMALQIAEQSGHPFSQLYANTYVGEVLLKQGHFESAVPLLERATKIFDETASEILLPFTASLLSFAYARLGRPTNGIMQICAALES
ncbi:MAG: ATP-binding protein, partial [Alphaproteobacteria bacterium]